MGIVFARRLRDGILAGEITTSVRIWRRPQVKVGGRYAFHPGSVEVTGLREITLEQVTPELARDGGFEGVVDLLKVARHGGGARVFLVTFVYHAAEAGGAG